MSDRGHLFIISGPAGAGKGTLLKRLFAAMPDMVYSVSCTTRAPRAGEVDGREYFFIDTDRFRALIDEGAFLEWAEVHGNYYGTRQADVEDSLARGCDVVLEIDVQGADNVRRRMPEACAIFIGVPSLEELRSRLVGRGSETQETLERRMRDAEDEIARARDYDVIVVNDDVDRAAAELIRVVNDRRDA